MTPSMKDVVSLVNAPILAKDRGIRVIESKTDTVDDFLNMITLRVKTQGMEKSHLRDPFR